MYGLNVAYRYQQSQTTSSAKGLYILCHEQHLLSVAPPPPPYKQAHSHTQRKQPNDKMYLFMYKILPYLKIPRLPTIFPSWTRRPYGIRSLNQSEITIKVILAFTDGICKLDIFKIGCLVMIVVRCAPNTTRCTFGNKVLCSCCRRAAFAKSTGCEWTCKV